MSRNILIIGNGFDLYHGLPTRYTDFLEFARCWATFKKEYKNNEDASMLQFKIRLSDQGKLITDSVSDFAKHSGYNDDALQILDQHICSNSWIEYFNDAKSLKEGWIDFEEEMYRALASVEYFYEEYRPRREANNPVCGDLSCLTMQNTIQTFGKYADGYNDKLISGVISEREKSMEYLKNQKYILLASMKKDMDWLIQCLKIYLSEFVSRIKIDKYSEQVKAIGICNVLNFNYTYTYQSVYDQRLGGCNHAIHGELKEDNLVLGIADDLFPNTNDYMYFTKYFQRLQKRTGFFYNEWLKYNRNALEDVPIEVHIMGHSLGKTDEAILMQVFDSRTVGKIYIYYHDQWAYENQIINLKNMLGRHRLVSETMSQKIEFVKLDGAIVNESL